MNTDLPTYEIVDITKKEHQNALFLLMNAYMQDPMGSETTLGEDLFELMKEGLKKQSNYCGVILKEENNYVGLANCFYAFSTFKAAPLLNIHDFIILKSERGKGFGRKLMSAVKDVALKSKCCKITLEVRTDNPVAQSLYLSEGFDKTDPEYLFWQYLL
nr:GNAT family N-acetyltransferase [uncultured Carboxylicivirga sp.]